MESKDGPNGRLQLTHIVRPGVTQASHYGIALARVTSLPRTVLDRAEELSLTMVPSTQVRFQFLFNDKLVPLSSLSLKHSEYQP